MPINSDKPNRWKSDISKSVDFYNHWFIQFAPAAFLQTRAEATAEAEAAMKQTAYLTDILPSVLRQHPTSYVRSG